MRVASRCGLFGTALVSSLVAAGDSRVRVPGCPAIWSFIWASGFAAIGHQPGGSSNTNRVIPSFDADRADQSHVTYSDTLMTANRL
jgi:hypothetical protein